MNILEQIVQVKNEEIRQLHLRYHREDFRDSGFFNRPTRSLSQSLRQSGPLAVIAEVKKASPAAGLICTDFDPEKIACSYEANQASAISVLTDRIFFQGGIADLRRIAAFCRIPLLRKDFIFDEYQIYEARAAGADAILLIAEILSASQITELTHAAATVNLDVLLELHSTAQLEKIDLQQNRLIGINNRNLSDLSVDAQTAIYIKKFLPAEVVTVAESGIRDKSQIEKIKQAGIQAILVGGHLLRAADPGAALHELKQWCNDEN
jgi:indole-3-glycerol phosphate synthase